MLNRPNFIQKHNAVFFLVFFSCTSLLAQQQEPSPSKEQERGVFDANKFPTENSTVRNPYSFPLQLPEEIRLAKPKVKKFKPTKEQLRTAKKYARLSFFRYLRSIHQQEETREIIVELLDWTYDDDNERYFVHYHIEFESREDNFVGMNWEAQSHDFELSIDYDGTNAKLLNLKTKKKYIYEDVIPKATINYDAEE